MVTLKTLKKYKLSDKERETVSGMSVRSREANAHGLILYAIEHMDCEQLGRLVSAICANCKHVDWSVAKVLGDGFASLDDAAAKRVYKIIIEAIGEPNAR